MNSELKPKIRFKGFTDDWEQRKFENIFNYERPDKYIVNSTEYLEFGPTPVLTANKAFILGYTTEKNKYVNSHESIIFDDFTLDTKFVDFPYMVKSSAIKILTLKDEKKDNIRFNFELLSNHRFNMLGHARHYISVVQPEDVFTTNKQEQNKIGDLFTNIDNLITLHQRKCDKLVELKKSLLEKMFPQNNSVIPEIRFKGFTDDWEQRKFGEELETITDYVAAGSFADLAANVKYLSNPSYAQLVRTVDIKNNFTSKDNVYVDKNAFNYLWRVNLKDECIIMPNIGNCGEIYLLNQGKLKYKNNVLGPNAILVRSKKNDNKFLSFDFQTKEFQDRLKLIISPNGQTKFNKTELKTIDLIVPNKDEQLKIGKTFSQIDNLITLHQRKHDKLNKIKQSLLNDMFV